MHAIGPPEPVRSRAKQLVSVETIKKGRCKGWYWRIFSAKNARGIMLHKDDINPMAAFHPRANYFLGMPKGHRGFVNPRGKYVKANHRKTWAGWKRLVIQAFGVAPPKEYTI